MHDEGGVKMKQMEWWRGFFSGLAVEMWDLAVSPEQTRKEADFIQKMLQSSPPADLLDVPCGSGRLAIELASRGFSMTAVDLSESFLKEARVEGERRILAITWVHREMRDLDGQNRYRGAFCFGNSFGYLDDDGNAEFLRAINRVLVPGARFVLDASSVAENVIPGIRPHTEMQIGDILFVEDNLYDHETGRLETDYTFVRGNQTEKKFGSHRLYTFRELRALLAEAGFEDCQSFGSMGGKPYTLGSEGLYFVATKRN
jgi:ubiquinone/menaquinone biosynthesis C-methylase UbiE